MIVIGLGHRFGVGKDAVATILVRDYGFVRRGFADALKEEVLARLPRTLDAMAHAVFTGRYAVAKEKGPEAIKALREELVYSLKPPVVRALLQEYGSELRRYDNPDYWTNRMDDWLWATNPARVVFTDVRFPNEVALVRARGGCLVRVDRCQAPMNEASGHQSEQDPCPNEWGYIIPNHGETLADLEGEVRTFAARFGISRYSELIS